MLAIFQPISPLFRFALTSTLLLILWWWINTLFIVEFVEIGSITFSQKELFRLSGVVSAQKFGLLSNLKPQYPQILTFRKMFRWPHWNLFHLRVSKSMVDWRLPAHCCSTELMWVSLQTPAFELRSIISKLCWWTKQKCSC